jgi:hypothetical protein
VLAPPTPLKFIVLNEFRRGRQLDQRNAQPGSIGADFGRLGIDFWAEVEACDPRHTVRKAALDQLNVWRNAIAHQDFEPAKLGGTTTLHLAQVRKWRTSCRHLARAFDEVMRRYLIGLTGAAPW